MGRVGSEDDAPAALIEIGWILVGPFSRSFDAVVEAAAERARGWLAAEFPGFDWRSVVSRRVSQRLDRSEPADLLALGADERERLHWDLALVVTDADLRTYQKEYAFGAPSSSIGVAVLSTARLGEEAEIADRDELLERRVVALAMHLFIDLLGVEHGTDPLEYNYPPGEVMDLDRMRGISAEVRDTIAERLVGVSDLRLEERPEGRRSRRLLFFGLVGWREKGAILRSVVEAQPWHFPLRLSRMSTAAVSALLIFMLTTEAWDLGMAQPGYTSTLLAVAAILGTSAYVLKKQKLVIAPRGAGLTEQAVTARLVVTCVVLAGIVTTYVGLFAAAGVIALLFYPPALIEAWASSLRGSPGFTDYITMANFAASIGVVMGALGASFEGERYIRHVTYVDEET